MADRIARLLLCDHPHYQTINLQLADRLIGRAIVSWQEINDNPPTVHRVKYGFWQSSPDVFHLAVANINHCSIFQVTLAQPYSANKPNCHACAPHHLARIASAHKMPHRQSPHIIASRAQPFQHRPHHQNLWHQPHQSSRKANGLNLSAPPHIV